MSVIRQASVRLGTIISAFAQTLAISFAKSLSKAGYRLPLSAIAGSTKIMLSSVLYLSKKSHTSFVCSAEPR